MSSLLFTIVITMPPIQFPTLENIMAALLSPELIAQYANAAKEANAYADEYKAITADADKRITDFINSSDDEQIVKYRDLRDKVTAQIEAAQARLDEQANAAKEYAESQVSEAEGDPAELKDKFVKARANANNLRKAFVLIAGEEAVNALVEEHQIEEVISLRGNKTKGSATGIRRPRLSAATVNGEAVANKEGNVTFGILEGYISRTFGKVTGDDLRAAAFSAAGTDDLNSLESGTEVKFGFEVPGIGGGNATTIQVAITVR